MTADWSHGYDVSTPYLHGFCREMAPVWLDFCAAYAGIAAPPREEPSGYRFLDLGCGQGDGLCVLAAANPGAEFVGVDFLAEHIDYANSLAADAGLTNVLFLQADFCALAEQWPAELGRFHYIAMHGVFSWVLPEVRRAVLDCIGLAAMPGALVYVSYNTLPGWQSAMPFQHLATLLKQITGATGAQALESTFALIGQLHAASAPVFDALPGLKPWVDALPQKPLAYLVGEYLHDHWQPFWHSQAARDLAAAGCDYVGPATLPDMILTRLLPPDQRKVVEAQPPGPLREDLLDFVVNQAFRRDIYTFGGQKLANKSDTVGGTRISLARVPTAGQGIRVDTSFGEAEVQYPAIGEFVAALADGPQAILPMLQRPALAQMGFGAMQVLMFLLHAGVAAFATDTENEPDAARRLNHLLLAAARRGVPHEHLAATRLGLGVGLGQTGMLVVAAWLDKPSATAEELARTVQEVLEKLGGKVSDGTSALEGAAALTFLRLGAEDFLDRQLPVLRANGAL